MGNDDSRRRDGRLAAGPEAPRGGAAMTAPGDDVQAHTDSGLADVFSGVLKEWQRKTGNFLSHPTENGEY